MKAIQENKKKTWNYLEREEYNLKEEEIIGKLRVNGLPC